MSINKPYFRIYRETINSSLNQYLEDNRYSNDRVELYNSFSILEKDLYKIFEYVEPSNENFFTYSHRLYELLLRSCTEFETNSKRILLANNYNRTGNWNITDYYKINGATKLDEYEIKVDFWHYKPLIIKPFSEWATGHSLFWYKEYNDVKHDRHNNFKKATLKNVIYSIAGVYCMLIAQFHYLALTRNSSGFQTFDDFMYSHEGGNIFGVKEYRKWDDKDKYQFKWSDIKTKSSPFQFYPF